MPNEVRVQAGAHAVGLDAVDRAILRELAEDGRIANNVLAARVGVAPSTCLTRVRGLREAGVIRGFHADVDLARLGRPLQAIVAVRLGSHNRDVVRSFHGVLRQIPGVISVFHVAGEDDYLVHVAVASAASLRDLILDHLTAHPAVRHTETHLVFEHLLGRGGLEESGPRVSRDRPATGS